MEDEVIALLKNSKLRTEISQVMADIYRMAGELYDNPTEDMEDIADAALYDEAWWRAIEQDEVKRIEDAFQKYVFNKIPVPHRIHLEEVLETFFDMAKPDAYRSPDPDSEYADSAYTSFLNYVNNRVLSDRRSTPFPVCTVLGNGESVSVGLSWTMQTAILKPGSQDSVSDENKQQGVYEDILWSNNAGVHLCLVGRGRFESLFKGSFHVMTRIAGRMSETVCKELSEEFKRILPSMWRSVKMLGKALDMSSVLLFPAIDESNLPVVSESDLDGGRAFVQKCLDAYFSTPTKKDTMDRRIRNAVHLLTASDAQSNDDAGLALGLALSVTAIEALLGQKGGDISQRLADNVAVLLEPELGKRQKATEFVKDLYDKRSRVLHGEEIEEGDHVRLQGRQLAAGVLYSMMMCRDFLKGGGFEPQTPQEFLKDLHDNRFEPGQPAGLWELNVRGLWR